MTKPITKYTKNAINVWDFTLNEQKGLTFNENSYKQLGAKLYPLVKKLVFQLEKGEEKGRLHYQGKFSLKTKIRGKGLETLLIGILDGAKITPTTKENMNDWTYVSKYETRVAGPYTQEDFKPIYIPQQFRVASLYPWQSQIIEKLTKFEPRKINILLDTRTNIGKTTLWGYIRCHKLGRVIPPMSEYKDILRMVCDTRNAGDKSSAYVLDVPKGMNHSKMVGFWNAIETLKSGYAYDDRNHWKECAPFDSPSIWIFTNTLPNLKKLQRDDVWNVWIVDENKNLIPYVKKSEICLIEEDSEEEVVNAPSMYQGYL